MWSIHELERTPSHDLPVVVRLEGPLDAARLEAGWRELLRRHELLRARFPSDGDRPEVQIGREPARVLAVRELSDEAEVAKLIEADSARPFDLEHGPVHRATLFRLGAERHVLFFNFHAIAIDERSLSILFDELAAAYAARPLLPPADHAPAEAAAAALEKPAAPLALPFDRAPPPIRAPASAKHRFSPSGRELPFEAWFALFAAFVARITGKDDLVLGTVFANRSRAEVERSIGPFANWVPVRAAGLRERSYSSLLERVQPILAAAQRAESVPFGRLVEGCDEPRTPYFNVALVKHEPLALELPGIRAEVEPPIGRAPNLDLALHLTPRGLCLLYAEDVFEASTIAALAAAFVRFAAAAVETGELREVHLAASRQPEREPERDPGPEPRAAVVARVAPRNELEAMLARIWCELLGLAEVGVHDDFFEIGGHSLLAVTVIARAGQAGLELTVRDFFEGPTIAELAAVAERRRSSVAGRLARRADPRELPLAFMQSLAWHVYRDHRSAFEHSGVAVWLEGELDARALEESLRAVIERHHPLRSAYREEGGRIRQIAGGAELALEMLDVSGAPSPLDAALAAQVERTVRPFALEQGDVVHPSLIRVGEREHLLNLVVHHLAFDGGSRAPFLDELWAIYRARREGRAHGLAPLPLELADFAAHQRGLIVSERGRELIALWTERLRGARPPDLPVDAPRIDHGEDHGPYGRHCRYAPARIASAELPAPVLAALTSRAQSAGATLPAAILAAVARVLKSWTGEDDVCLSSSYLNRDHPSAAAIVGYLATPLILRFDLSGKPGTRELFGRVRRTALEAYAHADVPVLIGRSIDPDLPFDAIAPSALARVVVNIQVVDRASTWIAPELRAGPVPHGAQDVALETPFELMIFARIGAQSLGLTLEADARLYGVERLDRFSADLLDAFGALAGGD
jgi:hypothetical protein